MVCPLVFARSGGHVWAQLRIGSAAARRVSVVAPIHGILRMTAQIAEIDPTAVGAETDWPLLVLGGMATVIILITACAIAGHILSRKERKGSTILSGIAGIFMVALAIVSVIVLIWIL